MIALKAFNCILVKKLHAIQKGAPQVNMALQWTFMHMYMYSCMCISAISKQSHLTQFVKITSVSPHLWTRWLHVSLIFYLIGFDCTTSLAPYIHMPPNNQISIWCQGGLWFGVFSFVNTTCRLPLLLTCRVTLAQAWNVILLLVNLCTELIWVCLPGKRAWIIYGHLSRRVCQT